MRTRLASDVPDQVIQWNQELQKVLVAPGAQPASIHPTRTMAITQIRAATEGRAYFDRKKASGKTSMEAMRALKRRLSDIVYRQMINDATAAMATGPGGHQGTTPRSSAAGSNPSHRALRTSHYPDPSA